MDGPHHPRIDGPAKDSVEAELIQAAAVAVVWLEALGYTMEGALTAVRFERAAQDAKWGSQRHLPNDTWLRILVEEIGEVAEALNETAGYG